MSKFDKLVLAVALFAGQSLFTMQERNWINKLQTN